jgi:hypothetical protein
MEWAEISHTPENKKSSLCHSLGSDFDANEEKKSVSSLSINSDDLVDEEGPPLLMQNSIPDFKKAFTFTLRP